MAKKAPSKHSRAARRATSPGIDTDKSLKDVKPPEQSANFRPAVLAMHQGAGVTKKSKQGRKSQLSSTAKRRQEKAMDRAEAIMERTATKVQKSKNQSRVIQTRRKAWDEINETLVEGPGDAGKKTEKQKRKEAEQKAVDDFFRNDADTEMDGAPADGSADGAATPPGAPAGDDDEIL